MPYADNDSKFVAVINTRHALPVVLNALAHSAYGLSGKPGAPDGLLDYANAATGFASKIHEFPFIVLECRSAAAMRQLLARCTAADGVVYNVFSTSMVGPSATEQREATAAAPADDLDLVVVVLFGAREKVDPLTKKFSLIKGGPIAPAAPANAAAGTVIA